MCFVSCGRRSGVVHVAARLMTVLVVVVLAARDSSSNHRCLELTHELFDPSVKQ